MKVTFDNVPECVSVRLIITLILILTAFCVSEVYAVAQFAAKGDRIFYNGQRISKAELRELLPQEDYQTYSKARNLSKFGAGMTGIGGTIFTFSAVTTVGGIIDSRKPINEGEIRDTPVGIAIFAGTMAIGGAIMAVGIPCLCVGRNRVKSFATDYNKSKVSLTLGPTNQGAGLCLNF